jgi:hypothetical protein
MAFWEGSFAEPSLEELRNDRYRFSVDAPEKKAFTEEAGWVLPCAKGFETDRVPGSMEMGLTDRSCESAEK